MGTINLMVGKDIYPESEIKMTSQNPLVRAVNFHQVEYSKS